MLTAAKTRFSRVKKAFSQLKENSSFIITDSDSGNLTADGTHTLRLYESISDFPGEKSFRVFFTPSADTNANGVYQGNQRVTTPRFKGVYTIEFDGENYVECVGNQISSLEDQNANEWNGKAISELYANRPTGEGDILQFVNIESSSNEASVKLLERDQLVSPSDGIEIERFRVAQTMSDETDKNYIIRRVTHTKT